MVPPSHRRLAKRHAQCAPALCRRLRRQRASRDVLSRGRAAGDAGSRHLSRVARSGRQRLLHGRRASREFRPHDPDRGQRRAQRQSLSGGGPLSRRLRPHSARRGHPDVFHGRGSRRQGAIPLRRLDRSPRGFCRPPHDKRRQAIRLLSGHHPTTPPLRGAEVAPCRGAACPRRQSGAGVPALARRGRVPCLRKPEQRRLRRRLLGLTPCAARRRLDRSAQQRRSSLWRPRNDGIPPARGAHSMRRQRE